MFDSLTFQGRNQYLPIQSGTKLSVASRIKIVKFLLYERSYKFVLGSRMTTDPIENYFSQVRRHNPAPTTNEMKMIIRALLIVNYYTKSVKGANCEPDEESTWLTQLKHIKELNHEATVLEGLEDLEIVVEECPYRDFAEENALNYFLGNERF